MVLFAFLILALPSLILLASGHPIAQFFGAMTLLLLIVRMTE